MERYETIPQNTYKWSKQLFTIFLGDDLNVGIFHAIPKQYSMVSKMYYY